MIKSLKTLLLAALLSLTTGCLPVYVQPGPGMIVTFTSLKKGVSIYIESARLPSGAAFPDAGSFGPDKNWFNSGKTMGAAPDGRQLPEWVEIEWQEPQYPEQKPEDFPSREAYSHAVREKFQRLPNKTQRVFIRDRVPQEAIEEVLQSKRDAPRGKLPEKMLWVYLVWTDDGIKFRWQVEREPQAPGEPRVLQAGGDVLP
jgi:hypothetical protein